MAKGKVISTRPLVGGGAKGGNGSMFGKQQAGSRSPGVTGKKDSGGGGKFIKGGSGHMFGKQRASQSRSGVTGK